MVLPTPKAHAAGISCLFLAPVWFNFFFLKAGRLVHLLLFDVIYQLREHLVTFHAADMLLTCREARCYFPTLYSYSLNFLYMLLRIGISLCESHDLPHHSLFCLILCAFASTLYCSILALNTFSLLCVLNTFLLQIFQLVNSVFQ